MTFKKYFYLLGLLALSFIISCAKTTKNQVVVYNNDFESGNLEHITDGKLELYNNTHVLGRYNADTVQIALNNLPKHKLARISFDLYIHGSWDGNKFGPDSVDGPDIWKMAVDNNPVIYTTFSNQDCFGGFCPPQSYPFNYPNNNNNPKSGAYQLNLPAVCGNVYGTTLYKIDKTIDHTNPSLMLQLADHLVQKNVYITGRICDESWSVDNIRIEVIDL